MKTWKEFCENLGGGLPLKDPNYSGAFPMHPLNKNVINIGPCRVALTGSILQIDTAKISMNLHLTNEQIEEIIAEFSPNPEKR